MVNYQSPETYLFPGVHVRYLGASIEQIRWGSNDDPRPLLTIGNIYVISNVEVHSQHTKLSLNGIVGRFNSVSFERVD